MNTFKRFIKSIFFKMDKFQRLQLLVMLYAHYEKFDLGEVSLLKAQFSNIEAEIDVLTAELFPYAKPKEEKKSSAIPAGAAKAATNTTDALTRATNAGGKSNVDPSSPGAKNAAKADAPPKEVLVDVKPFYDCKVLQAFGIEPKPIKFEDAKLLLPAFIDEASAKLYHNAYPTVEELEMVLDEAWDMASKGIPNKEICDYLEKNLGAYYTKNGLKQTSDYYKIANPYSKLTKILRRAFGEGYEDYKVGTTRPSYTAFTEQDGDIEFKKETDCSAAPVAEKKADTAKNEDKKPAEMKKVQEQKPAEKKVEVKPTPTLGQKKVEEKKVEPKVEDEETQESGIEADVKADGDIPEVETPEVETPEPEVEAAEVETEAAETVENLDAPPEVNAFDEFNDIEKLVFDKLKAGNLKASKEKDAAVQKSIKAESREDARLLIQSRFDADDWAQKDEKGFWKSEFLNYWNNILKEIGTRANAK